MKYTEKDLHEGFMYYDDVSDWTITSIKAHSVSVRSSNNALDIIMTDYLLASLNDGNFIPVDGEGEGKSPYTLYDLCKGFRFVDNGGVFKSPDRPKGTHYVLSERTDYISRTEVSDYSHYQVMDAVTNYYLFTRSAFTLVDYLNSGSISPAFVVESVKEVINNYPIF